MPTLVRPAPVLNEIQPKEIASIKDSATTSTPVEKTAKKINFVAEIIHIAMRANDDFEVKIKGEVVKIEKESESQRDLIDLKKELLDLEEGKESEKSKELIKILEERGITFSKDPTTSEIDLEIESSRLTVKSSYSSVEGLSQDQRAILKHAEKIVDMVNRFIERIIQRIGR